MGYQIRKGWPCTGAIDERLKAETGSDVKEGQFVCISADGNAELAAQDANKLYAFIFGKENLSGTYVGLMSDAVIEFDSADDYETGTYAVNTAVTFTADGKITEGSSPSIGRVIRYDATSGMLRIKYNSPM